MLYFLDLARLPSSGHPIFITLWRPCWWGTPRRDRAPPRCSQSVALTLAWLSLGSFCVISASGWSHDVYGALKSLKTYNVLWKMPQHTSFTPFTHANEPLPLDFSITQPWLLPVSYAVRPGAGFKPWGIACFLTFSASLSWCLSLCSLQHTFLTHQCLNQELTLDLLEKYRHPEKLKSCLVTDDEEMEVRLMKLSVCVAVPASDVLGLIVCFAVI